MSRILAAFSERGATLARSLMQPLEADAFAPEAYARDGVEPMKGGLAAWSAAVFPNCGALVFIGAAGIAVRAIAPHVRDKMTDPAVLVIDELGRHVIPILSGHVGGANALALEISRLTGAHPVITTATDINDVPAIDTWATVNDMAIQNPETIKRVSGAALQGQSIGVAITERDITPPFPVTLFLRPRTLTVGVGTKRRVDEKHLEECLMGFLKECGVSILSVSAFASIDKKADEPALLVLSRKYNLPLVTYTAEELRETPGAFAASEWVEKTVGVDNVCERAAVRHTAGRLLRGKTVYEGVTLALAAREENI